jgi:hypothetical protein
MKNKDAVLFLGVWGQLNNPSFNSPEFEGIRHIGLKNIKQIGQSSKNKNAPI